MCIGPIAARGGVRLMSFHAGVSWQCSVNENAMWWRVHVCDYSKSSSKATCAALNCPPRIFLKYPGRLWPHVALVHPDHLSHSNGVKHVEPSLVPSHN